MKLPDKHSGVMVNGSVRLELRDVAIGVSAAVWQLAREGVRAREHARAPFGQGEQGSAPLGAGAREHNAWRRKRTAQRGQGRAARFDKGGTNTSTRARSRLGFA
jgi:chorismate-pyruvate lyase